MIHNFEKLNKKEELKTQIVNNNDKIKAFEILKQVINANDNKVINKTINDKIKMEIDKVFKHTNVSVDTRTDFSGNKHFEITMFSRDNDCYKIFDYTEKQSGSVNYVYYSFGITSYVLERNNAINENRINAKGFENAINETIEYLQNQNTKLEMTLKEFDTKIEEYEKLVEKIKSFKNTTASELDTICKFDNIYRD